VATIRRQFPAGRPAGRACARRSAQRENTCSPAASFRAAQLWRAVGARAPARRPPALGIIWIRFADAVLRGVLDRTRRIARIQLRSGTRRTSTDTSPEPSAGRDGSVIPGAAEASSPTLMLRARSSHAQGTRSLLLLWRAIVRVKREWPGVGGHVRACRCCNPGSRSASIRGVVRPSAGWSSSASTRPFARSFPCMSLSTTWGHEVWAAGVLAEHPSFELADGRVVREPRARLGDGRCRSFRTVRRRRRTDPRRRRSVRIRLGAVS